MTSDPNNTDGAVALEEQIHRLYSEIDKSHVLTYEAFRLGYLGHSLLNSKGKIGNDSLLSVIDFSISSNIPRFYVIDLKNKKVLARSLVAHGMNSGEEFATSFSNQKHSHKSSLGFYITGRTYIGRHGFSLKLDGVEKDINDRAMERGIVVHAASYVSESFISKNGRIGRSHGCPALPYNNYQSIIETIKEGSCFFIYGPDTNYLASSPILRNLPNVGAHKQTITRQIGDFVFY